jgi:hypothetical protein
MAVEWLLSGRTWVTQTPIIDGVSRNVTASLGGLYLVHPTAALDMLARLVAAMTTGGVAAPAAFITEARYVRLTSSGTFTIDWTTGATGLRDLLGFTGNLAAASAYTATLRSPLLWSPGKVFTPDDVLGSHGRRVLDMSATLGKGGNLTTRREGAPEVVNRFSAMHVPKSRYHSAPPTPVAGDLVHFWENELCTAKKWHVMRAVTEGASTTTSAVYNSGTAGHLLGPYVADMTNAAFRRTPGTRSSGFDRVDAYFDTTPIPAVVTTQFA